MRRILLAFLLLIAAPAQAQFAGPSSPTDYSPRAMSRHFNGIYLDWTACKPAQGRYCTVPQGRFSITQGGVVTDYPAFTDFFTATGGVMTSGVKNCYNSSGVLVQFAANTPAQPCYAGDGALRGWVIEQQQVQLLTNPSLFTGSDWAKVGSSITSQVGYAPDATNNASILTEDSSTGGHWLEQTYAKTASPTTQQFVGNCHFRGNAGERQALLQLDDGGGNGAYATFDLSPPDYGPDGKLIARVATNIQAYGSFDLTTNKIKTFQSLAGTPPSGAPFWRPALTGVVNTSGTTLKLRAGLSDGISNTYTGNGTSSAYIWGCNLNRYLVGSVETATLPTSYIAFTGTRPIDRAVWNLPTFLQGAAGYTESLNVRLPVDTNNLTQVFSSLQTSDASQYLAIQQNNNSANLTFSVRNVSAAGTVTSLSMLSPVFSIDKNAGLAYTNSGVGGTIYTSFGSNRPSTNVPIPAGPLTQMRIGAYTNTGFTTTGNFGLLGLSLHATAIPTQITKKIVDPGVAAFDPDALYPPNYFTRASFDLRNPTAMNIWRQAKIPANDNITADQFPSYPGNIYYIQGIETQVVSTATTAKAAPLVWGSRCNLCTTPVNTKTNFYGSYIYTSPGIRGGTVYTTYARADADTMARSMFGLNYPAHAAGCAAGTPFCSSCPTGQKWCGYADPSTAAGIPDSNLYPWNAVNAAPNSYFTETFSGTTDKVMTDKIILPPAKISDNPGIFYGELCDCEQADDRLASYMMDFQTERAKQVHNAPVTGMKYAITGDSILSAGQDAGFCGAQATASNCDIVSLPAIISAVDDFSVVYGVPTAGRTFDQVISDNAAMLGDPSLYPHDHILAQFNISKYGTAVTIDSAMKFRANYLSSGFRDVLLAPNYADLGGAQCRYTNIKIQIVLGMKTVQTYTPIPAANAGITFTDGTSCSLVAS